MDRTRRTQCDQVGTGWYTELSQKLPSRDMRLLRHEDQREERFGMRSPGGYTILAAGDSVFLGSEGSDIIVELTHVTVPQGLSEEGIGDVTNTGTVEAKGGKIILASGDTFSRAIEEIML